MSPVRLLIVVIAAVSAIGMAVALRHALGGSADKPVATATPIAAPAKPMTQVLVAKRDLEIGARLAEADIGWQAWPSDSVNAAFITNGTAPPKAEGAVAQAKAAVASQIVGGDPAKALEGAIVRDPILTGEPITARKIVRGGEGGYLSVVLTPGKRAVAVPVSADTTAGGFILPGDRVDVLSTRDGPMPTGGGRVIIGETVLRNVRVLALDQKTAADKDAKTLVAATATLEVDASGAEALASAKAGGPVTLALRAYTDVGAPSGGLASATAEAAAVRINRGGQTTVMAVRP
ncbi:Flp pilus assembly protein CpaB [Caulobacter segnis]|uniref:Flp pilus assembly protein CpaB n=1 Tax=Caulobacter segnis TaxID=88688 RepID=UPI00285BCB58|nr:Flp pilus assembly protein CpaB [Caulobacter segnis]MDR6624023.1 pilus assembly protein CpaB [Caulobacter segnis]